MSGVVQMRVRENNPANGLRLYREGLPIQQPKFLLALEETTIDQ
jgi:hypothetical protein